MSDVKALLFIINIYRNRSGGRCQAASGIIDSGEAFSWGSREGEAPPLLEARIASVMNSKTFMPLRLPDFVLPLNGYAETSFSSSFCSPSVIIPPFLYPE